MLYESDVIEAVCLFLKKQNYTIHQQLSTTEKGDDIVAKKNEQTLFIEAKGETSESPSSKRYGKPFTPSQVRDHVSVALFKCAEVITREKDKQGFLVGIALPDNEHHRKSIAKIREAISILRIVIFWVTDNKEVKIEGNI